MAITRTTKKGTTVIDSKPVRIVLGIGTAVGLYQAYKQIIGEPRIIVVADPKKISQVKTMASWGVYEFKPLNIQGQAYDMQYQMTGVGLYETMNPYYNLLIKTYTYNDLRLLHNYWLKYIDSSKSLYDWINAEITNGGEELALQQNALKKLTNAGVGNKIKIKIPLEQYLIK